VKSGPEVSFVGMALLAIMTFARRLNHVENIPQQDSAERAFNKRPHLCGSDGGAQALPTEHGAVERVDGGASVNGIWRRDVWRILGRL
jgi:hypothetical protein